MKELKKLNPLSLGDIYLFIGISLVAIQYIILVTIDFIIFDGFYLHYIPELFGVLFFGFFFAHLFMWRHTIIIYILNIFATAILFEKNFTLEGMVTSAIVTSTLIIGDLFERYRQKQRSPNNKKRSDQFRRFTRTAPNALKEYAFATDDETSLTFIHISTQNTILDMMNDPDPASGLDYMIRIYKDGVDTGRRITTGAMNASSAERMATGSIRLPPGDYSFSVAQTSGNLATTSFIIKFAKTP